MDSRLYQRPRDQAVVDFIDDCVDQAQSVRDEYEAQWNENWSNYRVESSMGMGRANDKQYPLATVGSMNRFDLSPINFLKTPESHQGVNTLRALLLAGLFGTRDYVQADPVGDEDVEAAKRVSRLIMYGLERPGNFRTNFETLGDALIFGLGSYSARWRLDTKLVPRRMPVPDPTMPGEFLRNPDTGSIMTVLQNQMATVFDDPVLETDDLYGTWFDPAANRFSELQWKVKQFKIRDEALLALKDDPNWDSYGIGEVLANTKPSGIDSSRGQKDQPKLITENLTAEDVKDVAAYGYYGGWLLEGTIPEEVARLVNADSRQKIDPRGSVVLRMINGICVQSIQSPQRNGLIQGGAITVLPTGRGVYGLSPLTVIRYLQDVSDTQLILTVQAFIESVYQNYVIGADQGPNFARDLESRRPREVFTAQGDIEQIKPLERDYTGIGIAAQALTLISQTMRNAMNAKDPVQGIQKQSGNPSTATETQITATAALQNTDQLAVLIERDELPRQGMLINDLYYCNLDDEGKVFRRVGESEPADVSYFDIDATTDINFVGARSVLNKSARASQFRDFAMMIASNPYTAAAMDWHRFVERYGDEAMDVKGLEDLMIKDPDEIVARMQATGLAQTVRPQAGGAGPAGAAPSAKLRSVPGNGGRTGAVNPAQGAGEAGG